VEARFSAPVQTGSEAHLSSYTTGTGSFPGVKRPGYGVDHPPPSGAEVKERVKLYFYTIWAFVTYPRVNFTFYFLYLHFYHINRRIRTATMLSIITF